MIRTLIALVLGGIAATALVATASAAPKNQTIANLDCGSDGTFQVTTNNGNGQWTPAKIVGGGGTIIPLAFSNQHATFTDPEGNVFEEDDPDVSKHAAPPNKHIINCHFTLSFEDPSGGSGSFSGDVVAFIAGGGH